MYLSAHDSSLTAFMSGFQQKQEEQAFFASNILIELYRDASKNSGDEDEFSVIVKYNGKEINLGGKDVCADTNCPFKTVKDFLKSREYDGDLEETCNQSEGSSSKNGAWIYVLIAFAIFIVVANAGYFIVRAMKKKG